MHSFPLKHDFAPTKCMNCLEQLLAHGRHLQVNAVKNNFLFYLKVEKITQSFILNWSCKGNLLDIPTAQV